MVYGDNYSSRGPSYKWGGLHLVPFVFFSQFAMENGLFIDDPPIITY